MDAHIIVSCPYNPSHRIAKYKLMNHISKCKKTSKTENKVECPLDKSHIVDRDCLRKHIESCSSIGRAADMDIGNIPNAELPMSVNLYNSAENWEDDPEVPRYDPMEVSAKKPVLRCVSGLTKSEKKKFKENERIRIANLKGFHSASAASASIKDTIQDVPLRPLRPPRDTTISSIKVLQNDFDEKIHENKNHDHENDENTRTNFVPEFRNSSFDTMLYDKLAPKDDSIKQLEPSLPETYTQTSLKDFFLNNHDFKQVNRENGNFSIYDQNQEKKRIEEFKKTQMDTTSKLFNVDNIKKKEDECIANTSSASMPNERVTDTFSALLKDESSSKKVQPTDDIIRIEQFIKTFGIKGPILDEVYNKFNERLAHLKDIQNIAAEESARLSVQLKELNELREQMTSKK